jgi:hypothetical protein
MANGSPAGSRDQSGSARTTAASTSVTVGPAKGVCQVSI